MIETSPRTIAVVVLLFASFQVGPGPARAQSGSPATRATLWAPDPAGHPQAAADVLVPTVQGEWWQIAGDPDLGEFTDPRQQPVDFGIWQAADRTWQLWSCVRHTKCGGNTRLFYRWEGAKLTDRDWRPMGIAMQADAQFGETPGGLQAPFVFASDGGFAMFYGDWEHICAATSTDGKSFARRLNADGRPAMFGEEPGGNTRDPMVIRIGGVWHCYYAAHPNQTGAVYCRTSRDLCTWSAPRVVAMSGRTGSGPSSAECPLVVEPRPGEFYLFRTQRYGKDAQTSVYRSTDPLDFGINDDAGHFVCTLPIGAPEIFRHGGQYYVASLLPNVKGIQVARLAWVAQPAPAPVLTEWDRQAVEDAKHDRTTIIYDGKSPNKLVCDTTLRELPDGSWVLFMLAGGNTEPSPENYIGITRSTDHGKTWTALEPLDVGFAREGTTVGQGPTELMVRGGRSTLFFSTHAGHWKDGWRSWIISSDDSCKTWGKPEPAPGRLKERTFIRNHIVTRDGRIVVPFQHYIGPDAEQDKPPLERAFTNPRNGVLISDDGGKTWTEHGDIRLTRDDRYFGWAENNIAELSDGRMVMIIRADRLGGVLYSAKSKDGGRTWPQFASKTDIPNPGSKATLYPLGGDAVALLHNPNPRHRSPLALWVSFDGMKTWPYRRVLVPESCDGSKGRLNYPDGFVSRDGKWLHLAFDDNRHRAVYVGAKLPPTATPPVKGY